MNYFKKWIYYQPTAWGLLRIAIWTGIFLGLFNKLIPVPAVTEILPMDATLQNYQITLMPLQRSDPRGFLPPVVNTPEKFLMVWIGGSSLGVYQPDNWNGKTSIPLEVRQQLGTIAGREIVTALYFNNASRLYEEYLALLHALAGTPDFIVINLNPFWVFNNQAVSLWRNLYSGTVPTLGTRLDAWRSLFLFATPSQITWGLTAPYLPVLYNRWDYNHQWVNYLNYYHFINQSSPAKNQKTNEWTDIALNRPLKFWYRYGLLQGEDFTDNNHWLQLALIHSDTSGGTINDEIMQLMLKTLIDSNIPTLIYLAPVAPQVLADPVMAAKIQAIDLHLQEYANQCVHTSVRFLAMNPSKILEINQLAFKDLIHITESNPLTNYLTQVITEMLTSCINNCEKMP